MPIRVLIVEDEAEMAFALRTNFENRRGFSVAGVYPNIARTRQSAKEADIAIIDIKLPDGLGTELLPFLREKFPQMKMLIHTAIEDGAELLNAMSRGASGYLLKGTPMEQMFDHVQVIMNGGFTFSAPVASVLLGLHKKKPEADILTDREIEVVRNLALGFTSGEIARAMQLSAATVRKHLENIYRKLDVNSRSGAILFGIESGILRKP